MQLVDQESISIAAAKRCKKLQEKKKKLRRQIAELDAELHSSRPAEKLE
jgi:hypothetical protein